jgi:hypothetical protein
MLEIPQFLHAMLLNRLAILVTLCAFACEAEDTTFKKTKLALPSEPGEIPVDLIVSDHQAAIRSTRTAQTNIEIPFAAITRISYTESSRHRLSQGAKIAMISPGIGAATMLSKRRSNWLAIAWEEAGLVSTITLHLDKSETWNIRTEFESKTGRQIEDLDEKRNPFDPTIGSTDVDTLVPFGRDRVTSALHSAMGSFGCTVVKETPSAVHCRRKRGHSELTGEGGELVIATLEGALSETHVVVITKKAGAQSRNWSSVIARKMDESLAAGR